MATTEIGGNTQRRSIAINFQYKERLNQLCDCVERLEKFRQFLYPVASTPQISGEIKKSSPDFCFIETWNDHTEYFVLLLNRLKKVISELEEF